MYGVFSDTATRLLFGSDLHRRFQRGVEGGLRIVRLQRKVLGIQLDRVVDERRSLWSEEDGDVAPAGNGEAKGIVRGDLVLVAKVSVEVAGVDSAPAGFLDVRDHRFDVDGHLDEGRDGVARVAGREKSSHRLGEVHGQARPRQIHGDDLEGIDRKMLVGAIAGARARAEERLGSVAHRAVELVLTDVLLFEEHQVEARRLPELRMPVVEPDLGRDDFIQPVEALDSCGFPRMIQNRPMSVFQPGRGASRLKIRFA